MNRLLTLLSLCLMCILSGCTDRVSESHTYSKEYFLHVDSLAKIYAHEFVNRFDSDPNQSQVILLDVTSRTHRLREEADSLVADFFVESFREHIWRYAPHYKDSI